MEEKKKKIYLVFSMNNIDLSLKISNKLYKYKTIGNIAEPFHNENEV